VNRKINGVNSEREVPRSLRESTVNGKGDPKARASHHRVRRVTQRRARERTRIFLWVEKTSNKLQGAPREAKGYESQVRVLLTAGDAEGAHLQALGLRWQGGGRKYLAASAPGQDQVPLAVELLLSTVD